MYGHNIFVINLMIILSILVKLKGITNHLYKLSFILNAFFHALPSLILIYWYPFFKSSLWNIWCHSNCHPIDHSWKWDLIPDCDLIHIMESIQILHCQSLFDITNAGTVRELIHFLINPFHNNSPTCFFNSMLSIGQLMCCLLW